MERVAAQAKLRLRSKGVGAAEGPIMKPVLSIALAFVCLSVAPWAFAQSPDNGASGPSSSSGQSKPAANSQGNAPALQPSRVSTQTNSNPFPEDTSSVPLVPTANAPELPPGAGDESGNERSPMPSEDIDPVRSPEDAVAESNEKDSSSSLAGLGNLLSGPDDSTQTRKHGRLDQQTEPEHRETAKEDENVGSYYLDNKDWKGALSRFQSALVLDPYNPDVYWGLAESERHVGDFADARANYIKVTEYDPGSRHAKEARKALEDPEIANAKPSAPTATPSQ